MTIDDLQKYARTFDLAHKALFVLAAVGAVTILAALSRPLAWIFDLIF